MELLWQDSAVHDNPSKNKPCEGDCVWQQKKQDAVVQVPRSALWPLSADAFCRKSRLAAAAKGHKGLGFSIIATDGHVLLAPMESRRKSTKFIAAFARPSEADAEMGRQYATQQAPADGVFRPRGALATTC